MIFILTALLCLVLSFDVAAQRRSLVTETAATVPEGHALFEFGVEFLQDSVFRLSGLKGDLTRVGVYGLRIGAGKRIEVQMLGSFQELLNIEERFPAPHSSILNFAGNSTSAWGDLTMGTKLRLLDERPGAPALATRFAVQLPNTSNESGLGNDETNFFSSLIFEKHFLGKLRLITNLGLALLGDPVDAAAQDDLFSYGFGLIYSVNPQVSVISDTYGRLGPGGIGTEEQSRLRLGAQIQGGGLYWDVGALVGFRDTDPSYGLIIGISKQFRMPFFDH